MAYPVKRQQEPRETWRNNQATAVTHFNIYRHFVLAHCIVMVEQLSGGHLSDLSASTTTSHKLMKLKKNWELKPHQQNSK